MTNREQVVQILTELQNQGVRHLVVCPGGRNAPFVDFLSYGKHPFQIHTHFDERAASFFALGLSQNFKQPVAVLTTSGTAVSETLSACIEAHHTQTPLAILSADRPKSYRGSGAPQTIDQAELLSSHCSLKFDLEKAPLELLPWDLKSPIHINVCFDEPLVDTQPPHEWSKSSENLTAKKKSESWEDKQTSALKSFLKDLKKPLLVLSGQTHFSKDTLIQNLKSLNLPVFLESTSQLKNHPELKDLEIHFPSLAIQAGHFDSILRIGQVPLHRFWRDLEFQPLPTLHISSSAYPGLSEQRLILPDNEKFFEELQQFSLHSDKALKDKDFQQKEKLQKALKDHPHSEAAWMFQLQHHWPKEELVYLGNSLPIRQWDLANVASEISFSNVAASRGANGIDGQLSTFYGRSYERSKSLALLGDLTTLYDLSGPWAAPHQGCHHVAVFNNQGGFIFDRMFGKDLFLNRHSLQFEKWADFWNLPYQKWTSPSEVQFEDFQKGHLIEILPDAKDSKDFWESLR